MGRKKQPPRRPAKPYPIMGQARSQTGAPSPAELAAIQALELDYLEDIAAPFVWCLHCEQVHTREVWSAAGWPGPGSDCAGGLIDAQSWALDDMPLQEHPEYPAGPVSGGYYPLYTPRPRHRVGELGPWAKDVTPSGV